jgi:hypothetical protein
MLRNKFANAKNPTANFGARTGGFHFQDLYVGVYNRIIPMATAVFITAKGYEETFYYVKRWSWYMSDS